MIARKDTAGYRLAKFVRRNTLAVASAAVVAILVLGFAITMAILAARLRASDRTARGLADQAATLAEDLGTALDEKQQEELQRKSAEAARLRLQGKSEEAERLRQDVATATAELEARSRTLEELREGLGATDEQDEALSRLAVSRLKEAEDRLDASERQLGETRSRARETAQERDAAIDRAASSDQRLEAIGLELGGARDQIRRLESELAASRAPAETPTAGEPCRPGEELEDQGFVFARVCAGTFTIGSGDEPLAFEDEYPPHEVTLSEFWIGKYEVTNEQYRRWRPDHDGEAQLPAGTVGWTQARKFCKHFGFELPTEAEWEVAARAGNRTRWFFGDSESDLDAYAWYEANAGGAVHPVGLKQPNAWGLHDMYGNVWEWVADMWGPSTPLLAEIRRWIPRARQSPPARAAWSVAAPSTTGPDSCAPPSGAAPARFSGAGTSAFAVSGAPYNHHLAELHPTPTSPPRRPRPEPCGLLPHATGARRRDPARRAAAVDPAHHPRHHPRRPPGLRVRRSHDPEP